MSPIIYIIYVNDYPESVKKECSLSQFADDTALWTSAYTRAFAMRKLQRALNELESWCRKWRVKLNGDKSSLIFISRNHKDDKESHALHLFNDIIRPVNSAKFLGVEIDSRLTFNKHIDSINNKATKRINLLKMLARHGVNPTTLMRLYKIYVRPLSEYGSASFITAPSSQFDRLKRIENEAIRASLHLPKYIRTTLLHEYASLEPIRDRLLKLNASLLSRMKLYNADVLTLCDSQSNHENAQPVTPITLITNSITTGKI